MSKSDAQESAVKKRNYRLGRRAEKAEETRRRIVEATVELHCTVGPARTTVSQIAEKAGVQRHTFYAHFPTEWDLALACSGLALGRDPLPDPEPWLRVAPSYERVSCGLAELYAWYQRNEGQAACVMRDVEVHEITQRIVALRIAPTFTRAAEVLGEELPPRALGLLAVALQFPCWRTLCTMHTPESAAALMAEAIVSLKSA